MRCFINFSLTGFSNSYLVGPNEGGEAIVIDPGELNVKFLNLIENNNFYIKHILVTHNHRAHISGIRTLLKIYDAEIYSASDKIMGVPSNIITKDSQLNLSGIEIKVMEFPGHSNDSLIYQIHKMLFTGDTLSAGNLGDNDNLETVLSLRKLVSNRIKNMDDSILVFPGHGPPSTVKAEKDFNPELFV